MSVIAREYSESDLDNLSPLSFLRNALKPGTNISVNTRDYLPDRDDESNDLIELDCGSLSYVLYEPGRSFVVKKLHYDPYHVNGELVEKAENEADMTMNASQVFSKFQSDSGISVKVPGNANFIENWEDFWNMHKYSLPSPWNFPTPSMKMDLIYPLPKAVGRALIQKFHPKRAGSTMDPYVVEEILNQPKNKYCLVQPCLGLRARPREPGDFSLHNFQLSLADMHRIDINVIDLARAIGKAFAVIHFDCGLSGRGVKLAFGLSMPKKPCTRCLYTVDLYLFDFGDCWKEDNRRAKEGLNMAEKMLEPGARKFIPSPLNSPTLYKIFTNAYIEHAKKNIGDERNSLPYDVMTHYGMLAARLLPY